MADPSTTICGLSLRNPVILASGIWGETGATLAKAAEKGAGAVVTKSIGSEPKAGYANPTVVEIDTGVLNAIGLANPGIVEYHDEVKVALKSGVPVIGSIFGKDPNEFSELGTRMASYGVHALELNLGCPHAKGYGAQQGQDPEMVKSITEAVKGSVRVPVMVKVTPNVTDIGPIAEAVRDGGGDAIVAINTVRGMAISARAGTPILKNGLGGYSGRGIKPIGLANVWSIRKAVDIPIIGVGGIGSGEDVAEYLMAGASCVQIGTVLQDRGEDSFKFIIDELTEFMDDNGYDTVDKMVGIAHR